VNYPFKQKKNLLDEIQLIVIVQSTSPKPIKCSSLLETYIFTLHLLITVSKHSLHFYFVSRV